MATRKPNLIIVLLLGIHSALGEPDYNSPFTKEIKLQKGKTPFKLGNELAFFSSNIVISREDGELAIIPTLRSTVPGREECHLTPFDFFPEYILNLGNGKILMISDYVDNLNVFDFKNCTSYSNTVIKSNSTRDHVENANFNYKTMVAVAYNDTFDVFDHFQRTCTPCRYNDKGERLKVEHSLEREPGLSYQFEGFSIELIKDAFGVKNGYFYALGYNNYTTALRILDFEFKVVKQRVFNAQIVAHSMLQDNVTVCYRMDACPNRGFCYYIKCHLLDSNLNTIAEVELHKINTAYEGNKIWADVNVQNLVGGGAMVALKFHFDRSQSVHRKDVFLQRIHPNGHVDKPIPFESFNNDFTHMYVFTFDNGEYCLVTVNDYYIKGSYTLIKCLYPSSA